MDKNRYKQQCVIHDVIVRCCNCGNVEEEKIDNVTYIHLNNLKNLIKTTPFHTIIVSRYLNFY